MTKTPWNWIITAFVFAALFLVSLRFYLHEANYGNSRSNSTELVRLKKDLQEKMEQISVQDGQLTEFQNQLDSKNKIISKLKVDLSNIQKENRVASPQSKSDSEEIKRLKSIIDSLKKESNNLNEKLKYFSE